MPNWAKTSNYDIELFVYGKQPIDFPIDVKRPNNESIAEFLNSAKDSDKSLIGIFGPNHYINESSAFQVVENYCLRGKPSLLYSDYKQGNYEVCQTSWEPSFTHSLSPLFICKNALIDFNVIQYKDVDEFLNQVRFYYLNDLSKYVQHIPSALFRYDNSPSQ